MLQLALSVFEFRLQIKRVCESGAYPSRGFRKPHKWHSGPLLSSCVLVLLPPLFQELGVRLPCRYLPDSSKHSNASISFPLPVTRDYQPCGEMLRCWGQRGPAGVAGGPSAAGSAPREMQRGSGTKPPTVLGMCPPRSGGHLMPVQQHGPCYQACRSQMRP